MNKKIKLSTAGKILFFLSGLGLIDAVYLTFIHLANKPAECSVGDKFSKCNAVLQSPYASIGPIPTAFLGIIHYSILGLLAVMIIRSLIKKEDAFAWIVGQTTVGVLFSIYFVYLQIWIIKAICLFCMISAIINFIFFAIILIFFRQQIRFAPIYLAGIAYRILVKPIFFLLNPERVHESATSLGQHLGKTPFAKAILKTLFVFNDPILEQKIAGISFKNPIGLAAGFDHEARLTQILSSLGFGFQSIGSITYEPCEGNPSPKLGRLPRSKSLMVNKGLKNKGVTKAVSKLKKLQFKIPLGISVAKTNSRQSAGEGKAIKDYVESFRLLKKADVGDYYELNISCPNAFGGEPFTTPKKLEKLLAAIDKIGLKKPLFIKMPVDFSPRQTNGLCKIIVQHNVQGVIFGNLTKDRKNPALDAAEAKRFSVGNFSGKPTEARSNRLIAFIYKKYGKKLIIIGCGGVFDAKDAYRKIKLGASLVQLITGLIYQGPQLVAQINLELAGLIKKDGYKNIAEAVGRESI